MIEYIYDAVRATAGEEICICAEITDNDGMEITEHCHLMLYDDLTLLTTVNGTYENEVWSFTIPAEITAGLKGRFWYCICVHNTSLCFKQPIYLI